MNNKLEEDFQPVTFELLSYNKVLSDFYLDTPNGQIREFVNRSPNIQTRQTIYKNGNPVVLRYLSNCPNTIVQSEQVLIDKELYGANVHATMEDMNDCRFIKGILVARKPHLALYLKSIGQYQDLDSSFTTDQAALYKLHNPLKEIEDNDEISLKTVDAIQKYRSLSVENQKAVLVKYFGAAYQLPEEKRLITVALSEANQASTENQTFLDLILEFGEDKKAERNENVKGEIELLVSLLLSNKTLDIDTDPAAVTIKGKDGKSPIKLHKFDKDIVREARVELFVEWLGDKEGAETLKMLNKQPK